jgi:hypothetical protein
VVDDFVQVTTPREITMEPRDLRHVCNKISIIGTCLARGWKLKIKKVVLPASALPWIKLTTYSFAAGLVMNGVNV